MATHMTRWTYAAAFATAALLWGGSGAVAADKESAKVPAVGDAAPAFELPEPGRGTKSLESALKKGPAVVVVLRGNPGYVCPACTAQFGDFVGKSKAFNHEGVEVLFIYPGPAEKLEEHAASFLRKMNGHIPERFHLLLDPDYVFTNAYGLRWEGKNETAYPATFIVDGQGKVAFAAVSKVHGGRTPAADVLKFLDERMRGGGASDEEDEGRTYEVHLTEVDPNHKLGVIQVLRTRTDLSLLAAKELAEGGKRPVLTGLSKRKAESLKRDLEEEGAKVEIK